MQFGLLHILTRHVPTAILNFDQHFHDPKLQNCTLRGWMVMGQLSKPQVLVAAGATALLLAGFVAPWLHVDGNKNQQNQLQHGFCNCQTMLLLAHVELQSKL